MTEVPVDTNAPLKEGDVLFRIDPTPFQYVVDQKRAGLAEAEQQVRQLKASLDQATAEVEQSKSNLKLQEDTYNRQLELLQRNVVAQAALDTAQRNYDGAKQAQAGAAAAAERARLAYSSEIGGINPTVARLASRARRPRRRQCAHQPGALSPRSPCAREGMSFQRRSAPSWFSFIPESAIRCWPRRSSRTPCSA